MVKLRSARIIGVFILQGFAALTFHSTIARAAGTPVYLGLGSRYPSGSHPRAWLETRTKEQQIQRWFRVKSGAQFGWLPEDQVLTALKLSSIARANRDEPDRSQPSLDALRPRRIAKGSQIIVLEIAGSWARVRILGEDSINQDSWVLTEALSRDRGQQIERGIVFVETPMRVAPRVGAPVLERLSAYKEVTVLKHAGAWLEVPTDAGSAWIDRQHVWLHADIADGTIRPLHAGLELRSAPLPNADVVTRLIGTEKLSIVSTSYLKWGKVKIPEHGWLWWPIADEPEDGHRALPPIVLSTKDLLDRRIYDMAASPQVPGLRFASAEGVFLSRDGVRWSMIPKFEDKNYPIVVASTGPLFVGPYLSNDNGETFEQWIRWDRLVEVIKHGTGSAPQKLRIVSLEARDQAGRNLVATLDLGRAKAITAETPDRGVSWLIR